MQNVYVIRGSVRELTWCYSLFVLGFLCTKCFLKCFEFHRENDGYPVVMKYISVTIRVTLLTVEIWMLVPVEEEMV